MPDLKQLKLKEADATYFLVKSALYIFFISDACNKILYLLHSDFYRVSILFRSLYEGLFFLLILLFINETRLLFLKIFLSSFILFIAGQLIIFFKAGYDYNFPENISLFNKYFFVFIIFFAIYKLLYYPDKLQKILKAFERVLLINSVATFIGFFLQIDLLRTYTDNDFRYGYSGFIPAQNEATLFFFIAISYFYYQHFILKIKSKKFYFVLLSCFLLGTKGIYLFLVLLLIFHFLYHSSLKTKLISLFTALSLLGGCLWYLTTESSQKVLGYFIYQAQRTGWLNTMLSGRNTHISTKGTDILYDWTIPNYFIGGMDQTKVNFEMDFFDLFFFLGIIGSTIFLALYFSSIFKFNILKPFNFFFVISFFAIAFFAGHFFASAINALYLCIISLYLYQTQHYKILPPEQALHK
jgi:hypothetical protein